MIPACASVDPHEPFADVQQTLEKRTQTDVAWRTGGPEDQALDQAIDELLSQPLNADAAAQLALLNNRHLQATYEQLGIAQADLVQAGLLSNPVFSTSVTFPTESGAVRPNLGVTQSFLDILYRPLRQRVAEADLLAVQQRVAEQVIDHAAQTRSAFYRVQADQHTVDVIEQVLEQTGESLETMRELHATGQLEYLDVRNKEALYEQTRLELARARSALRLSREQVNVLMGVSDEQLDWEIDPELPELPEQDPAIDELERQAMENSLTLAALDARLAGAEGQLTLLQRSALLPTADAGVQAQRRSGQWFLGPQLSLPLPLFDRGQAQQSAAASRLRQHQHRYDATAIEIGSAARQTAEHLQLARHVVDHYHEVLLPLREQIYQDSVLQYNAAQITILELIDAREQQLSTQQQYIQALHDYWVARTHLDQVVAGGTLENITRSPAAGELEVGGTNP